MGNLEIGVLVYFLVVCIFLEMSLVDLGQKVSNYLQNVKDRRGQMDATIKSFLGNVLTIEIHF